MAYEVKPNTGSLFRNEKKETENHPDYTGSALIDGADLWMSAWLKTTGTGTKWMSFAFKRKDVQSSNAPAQRSAPAHDVDLDDDVPF